MSSHWGQFRQAEGRQRDARGRQRDVRGSLESRHWRWGHAGRTLMLNNTPAIVENVCACTKNSNECRRPGTDISVSPACPQRQWRLLNDPLTTPLTIPTSSNVLQRPDFVLGTLEDARHSLDTRRYIYMWTALKEQRNMIWKCISII